MTAKIYDTGEGLEIVAAPNGEYGFGTIGAATPGQTLIDAWRMVQRAGLARVADVTRPEVRVDGARTEVAYPLRSSVDLSRIPARAWGN